MKKVAVCWSGGKDSCLALYRLLQEKHEVVCLLSMVSEEDERNHAHGIRLDILQLQADAIDIPLIMVNSAGEYEASLIASLTSIKEQHGLDAIAFGSLYMEEDRKWNKQVAEKAGLEALFPVWILEEQASELLEEFISLGFQSIVCRASADILDSSWTGRVLNASFCEDIEATKSCSMGEHGEYHTFVVDGPIFRKKLEVVHSDVILNSGLWSLDIQSCRFIDKDMEAVMK
ncbi:diphthine--ammonia ligase [Fictibacillus sp. 5RED26]|uniref:Dph6-related ATP pyrophosphatase n=1 Tax=Fictibacillus sp. 5RED26 TaxID=2745876 RepID=UPI0018CE4E68|nr:diphthine--ammonia ligase [Fictibacillus sp. 5RED26]MBH0155309.1 diphthine--ammonia ligase [Fictibacillus sp. 5RED26]